MYHLIPRFVAREYFIETGEERRGYLTLLGFSLARTDWRCFSYGVMSNHVHLGLLAGEQPLAEWIRPVHTDFAKWINERRERIGAVFVRGPNVIEVQPEGAARLIGYIHCNPVRAGLVTAPRDSEWTSHRAYLGLAPQPSWLDVELGLELAGFRDGAALDAALENTAPDRRELAAVSIMPRRVGRPAAPPAGIRPPQSGQLQLP